MKIRLAILSSLLSSFPLLFSNPLLITSLEQHEEVLKSVKPALILYTNPISCPPCKIMKPEYDKVSKAYEDINFYIVDVTKAVFQPLLKKRGISSVPFTVFNYNNQTIAHHRGRLTETELKKKIACFKEEIRKMDKR